MNDLFNLPPDRELPDATRDQARDRIVLGLRGERRGSRALLPISIAAAAVVLVGGAAGLVALQHPGSRAPATASTASHQAAPDVFPFGFGDATLGRAPADQVTRCAAENARKPAGRPDPAQWQPILTTSAPGMSAIAFHTSSGPLFCELTPAMVTLSSPTSASAGAVPRPTFVTAFGTVAGVSKSATGFHHLWVKTTDRTSQLGSLAWERDGVFISVNAVHVPAPSLTFTSADRPDAPGHPVVVVPDAARLLVAPTQDRPLTPADQTSPAGHRLAECLPNTAGGPGGPAVDRAAWVPGESATMTDHGTVQLGTYGGLLAVCTLNTQQNPAVSLSIVDTTRPQVYTADNPYISVAEVANETPAKDGFDVGPPLALPGLVKSAKVATVTLSGKGKPTITTTVHSGTFLMSGADLETYYRPNADPHGTLTVRSASGAVLTTLSLR
jgi:hypothetical protein